ncbi:MAG: hypothetical protein Q8R04_07130, partial [Nanoarchaeota archaeon]|nr:hypothetical protein [Nanoarchaeota archaeon]
MAEETKLEQTAKTAPATGNQEKKKGSKKVSTLESVVNDLNYFVGNILKIGLAAGIPFAQATLLPPVARDTAILAGAQVAADATTARKRGEKYAISDLAKSSAIGTGIAGPTSLIYNLINKIPLDSIGGYLGRAAAFGGIVYPFYIGLYQILDHTIRNMSFKGLGKYLKENYWTSLKRAWKYVFPFGLANVLFAPAYLQIPIGALLSYIVALFGAPKKGKVPEEKKRDKTPYLVAASNAFYKLGSSIFNLPYNIGRAVYEVAKSPKQASPAARPA